MSGIVLPGRWADSSIERSDDEARLVAGFAGSEGSAEKPQSSGVVVETVRITSQLT